MADYGERKPVRMNVEAETITDAMGAGDRLRELQALLAVLATHLDNPYTPSSAVASLSRQYRDLSEDVERLKARHGDVSNEANVHNVADADWTLHAI